jgi:hypothetical protein
MATSSLCSRASNVYKVVVGLKISASPIVIISLKIMSSSWCSTTQPESKQHEQDELTEWRDSTNVILDYYQAFLQYGSTTDHVQLSSQVVFR